jgi:hypothetical protein
MHASTLPALIRTLTWGVILPVALFLVLINTLTASWASRLAQHYTVPLVITDIGMLFLVQSLRDRQREAGCTRR